MFKRKPQRVEVEHRITFENAEALNIKKTGSYILCLNSYIENSRADEIIKMLKKETGAKWIIIQGGAKVITNV